MKAAAGCARRDLQLLHRTCHRKRGRLSGGACMVQHAGLSGPSGMCDNHHAGMFQACKSSHAVCHESTCEAPGFAGPFQRFLSTRAQPAQSMICCRQPVESQTPGATPPSAAWSRAPLMPSPRSKAGDSRRSMACSSGGLAKAAAMTMKNGYETAFFSVLSVDVRCVVRVTTLDIF